MKLQEIFTEVFLLLKEDISLQKQKDLYKKFSDMELIGYANDCQEDMVKRLPLADILNLQNHLTISKSADEDILLPGAGLYPLPTNFLREDSVIGQINKRNANKVELQDLWDYQAGYIQLSATMPIYCIVHYGNVKKIVFAPKENKILLVYYRQPTVLTTKTETPQVDVGVHHLFVPYICYKILMGLNKMDKAKAFKIDYTEGIKNRGGL